MSKRIIAPPRLLSIASAAALVFVSGAVASAQEFPTYEVSGFPITPLQLSVLNTDHVQERSPSTTLTMGGMPASPSQINVLGAVAERARMEGELVTAAAGNRLALQTRSIARRVHNAAPSSDFVE